MIAYECLNTFGLDQRFPDVQNCSHFFPLQHLPVLPEEGVHQVTLLLHECSEYVHGEGTVNLEEKLFFPVNLPRSEFKMIHVVEEMGQVGRIRFREASANVTLESCAFPPCHHADSRIDRARACVDGVTLCAAVIIRAFGNVCIWLMTGAADGSQCRSPASILAFYVLAIVLLMLFSFFLHWDDTRYAGRKRGREQKHKKVRSSVPLGSKRQQGGWRQIEVCRTSSHVLASHRDH